MSKQIIDIIICEKSDLLIGGIRQVIREGLHKKQLSSFKYKIISCSENKELKKHVKSKTSQILIAKPETLQLLDQSQYSHLKTIALVYAYYAPETLSDFNAIIRLHDDSSKIYNIISSLIEDSTPPNNPSVRDQELLTNREKEILKLLVSGFSTKEISAQLFISIHTVNNHRKNIIKKLGISTISGLTIYAVIRNIIDPKTILKSMH